jgi:hypothetical protein
MRLGPEAARGVPNQERCMVTQPAQFLALLISQDANADGVHGNSVVDGASDGSRFAYPVLLIVPIQLPLRLLLLLQILLCRQVDLYIDYDIVTRAEVKRRLQDCLQVALIVIKRQPSH